MREGRSRITALARLHPGYEASSAAIRSAAAASSGVLTLKNGSTGATGQSATVDAVPGGPDLDLAQVLHHQGMAQVLAQLDRP